MMFDADCHSVMAAWNQKRRDPGMLEERRKKAVQMIVVDGAPKREVAKRLVQA